jgi:hypothetical protein
MLWRRHEDEAKLFIGGLALRCGGNGGVGLNAGVSQDAFMYFNRSETATLKRADLYEKVCAKSAVRIGKCPECVTIRTSVKSPG